MLCGMRRRLFPLVGLVAALALVGAAPPNDPLLSEQWHLAHVGVFQAWDAGQGQGTTVAVVDTGVNRHHPDLRGRLTTGVDLVDPGTLPDDPSGHGTLVAGVVAALAGNGLGGAGAAPDARIMPVRVLDENGSGTAGDVAAGIRWASNNGADVINLSLAELPSNVSLVLGSDVEEAIQEAHRAGALVVAAAGNGGRHTTPYHPDSPALVVGASDRADQVWARSNRDSRTLFAPGTDIVSTHHADRYARADGTSFAAPVVSAAGALLRGAGMGNQAASRRLLSTATPIGAGAGRVDVAAATASLRPAQPVTPEPSPSAEPAPSPEPAPTPAPEPSGSEPAPTPGSEPGRTPEGGADPTPGSEEAPDSPASDDAGAEEAPTGTEGTPAAGSGAETGTEADSGRSGGRPQKPEGGADNDLVLDTVVRHGATQQAGGGDGGSVLEGWQVGLATTLVLATAAGHVAVLSRGLPPLVTPTDRETAGGSTGPATGPGRRLGGRGRG